MTALFAAGYISDSARTNAQMKQALEDLRSVAAEAPGGGSEVALTIAAGAITPAANAARALIIDTEAAAATDDLTNIVQTNVPDGSLVLVRNANAARLVVVKHMAGGAGQVNLRAGADAILADTKTTLLLRRNGTQFDEVRLFPDRYPILSKGTNYTLTQADHDAIIRITASITLTLPTASVAGNGWRTIVTVDSTFIVTFSGTINGVASPKIAGGGAMLIESDGAAFRGTWLNHSMERVDVADGATLNLQELVIGSRYARAITSTTTITAVTLEAGGEVHVLFDTTRSITNGASLLLRGGVSQATKQGDMATFRGESGSVVRLTDFSEYDNSVMRTIASGNINTAGDTTISIPAGAWQRIDVDIIGLESATDFMPFLRVNNDATAIYDYVNSINQSGATTNTVGANQTALCLFKNTSLVDESDVTDNTLDMTIAIMDPAGVANHKNVAATALAARDAGAAFSQIATNGRWKSTAAVTSLVLLLVAGTGANPTGVQVLASGGRYRVRGYL